MYLLLDLVLLMTFSIKFPFIIVDQFMSLLQDYLAWVVICNVVQLPLSYRFHDVAYDCVIHADATLLLPLL